MPTTQQALENATSLGIRPDRLELLEELLNKLIREDRRQAIVVKATRYGIPIFEGTYGVNTKEYGVKLDTIFPVASITKPVVATLLLCLQEDGLVDLTHAVWRYLPEFDGLGKEKICLWHFITHTSGIKEEELYPAIDSYVKDEFGIDRPSDNASEEDWQKYHRSVCEKMGIDPDKSKSDRFNDWRYQVSLKLSLPHKPRSHMTYCNYGYQRLKDVIDAVTGEPTDSYAQRRLFNPLGMTDTYWRVPEDKWYRILGRNERCMGYPWINTEHNYLNESGSGGLKTTVPDMTRFCQMIVNGGSLDGTRVLSKASIAAMITDHNENVPCDIDSTWSSWGLGWNYHAKKKDDTGILRSPSCLCHGGWGGTKIILDPETGLTFAIFAAAYELSDKEQFLIYGPLTNVLYSALE